MASDYIAAVARWLADRTADTHQFGALAGVADSAGPDRRQQLDAVQAAVERLAALGLVDFHHHLVRPVVATRHRAGLRRLAAGEPLATVVDDVERDRPVTILRIRGGNWAAWYLSILRLPAGAATTGAGGALGATPDEALAALRHRTRVTAELDSPPDQTLTGQ